MSGPRAEDREERARALSISKDSSSGQSLNGSRMEVEVATGAAGKP